MKNVIFTSIILLGLIYFSSCKGDGTCPDNSYEYYKTTEMIEGTGKLQEPIDCNEILSGLAAAENEVISYSKLSLSIYFNTTFVSGYPECASREIIDTIKNLIITSDNDYNSQYKKGDTLNDILTLKYFTNGNEVNCSSLISYLENNAKCRFNFYFFFNMAPDTTLLHTFNIFYEENNGTAYQASFTPIYLEP